MNARGIGGLRAALIGAVLMIAGAGSASAQSITFSTFTFEVGSGLQTAQLTARLSDSQHGGITVHIASVDTFLALVADGAQTPGTGSIDVFVPNGSIIASFFVQALEDTLGMVSITASAPGFGSVIDSVEVVEPGMRLNGLLASNDVSADHDNFQVQVGIPTSTQTSLIRSIQRRRFDSFCQGGYIPSLPSSMCADKES